MELPILPFPGASLPEFKATATTPLINPSSARLAAAVSLWEHKAKCAPSFLPPRSCPLSPAANILLFGWELQRETGLEKEAAIPLLPLFWYCLKSSGERGGWDFLVDCDSRGQRQSLGPQRGTRGLALKRSSSLPTGDE